MLSLRTLLPAAAAALAVCAAAVPTAGADVDRARLTHEYSATITTDVDYNIARTGTNDLGVWSSQLDDEFTVKTEIPRIRFVGGMPSYNNPAYSTATATRGHLLAITAGSGSPVTCTGNEIQDLAGGAVMGVLSTDVRQFKVRVLDGLTRRLGSCSGPYPAFLMRYDMLGAPLGEGYFDATVDFPGARLGSDHAQLLHGEVSGAKCPGYDEDTTVCLLTWDAEITFHHVSSVDEGTPPPLTPEELPEIGKPTPPAPRPVPKTKAYTVQAASLDARAGTVTVPVRCASACSGVATASLPTARAAAAAKKAKKRAKGTLATARFRAAAGTTAKVVLRIPKAQRAKVRRAKALTVRLAITPQGGTPVTETLKVKRGR
jgi:hypothetical protein